MATSFLTDILARHAAEIEAEIELRTMNIMAELQGIRQLGLSAPIATKAARAAKPGPRKGAKRTPEALEELTSALYSYVKKHPGERIEQIAIGMGVSTKELVLPIKKLRATKQLSVKGEKRASAYSIKA